MTALRNFAYVANDVHSSTLDSLTADGHQLQTRSPLPSIPWSIDIPDLEKIELIDATTDDVLATIEHRTVDDVRGLYVDDVLLRTIDLQQQEATRIVLRDGSLQLHDVNYRKIGDVIADGFDEATDPFEVDEFGDPIPDYYTGSLDIPVDWSGRSIHLRITPATITTPWSLSEQPTTLTISQIRTPLSDTRPDCPDAFICPYFPPFGVAAWRLESQTVIQQGVAREVLRTGIQRFDHCQTAINQLIRTSPRVPVELHSTGVGFDDGGFQSVEYFGAKIDPTAVPQIDLFDAATDLTFTESDGQIYAECEVLFRYPAAIIERSPIGSLETDDLTEIRSVTPLEIGLDLMGGINAQSDEVILDERSDVPGDVTYGASPTGTIQFVEDKRYAHQVGLNLDYPWWVMRFRKAVLPTDTTIEFTFADIDGDIVDGATGGTTLSDPTSLTYYRPTGLEFRGVRLYALVVSVFGFGGSASIEEQPLNAFSVDTNAFSSVTLPNNVFFAEFGPGQEIDGFDRYRLGGGWREWRFKPTFTSDTVDLTTLAMRFTR